MQFYEFLVVECCISLNMHFLQSLLEFEIFLIKVRKYLLLINLVLNAFFVPICHVKLLTLSKTTSFQKLFDYGCMTLYSVYIHPSFLPPPFT